MQRYIFYTNYATFMTIFFAKTLISAASRAYLNKVIVLSKG